MVLAATPCFARDTTTAQVGDVADFLMNKATCKDFIDAIRKIESPHQTLQEILISTLGVIYMEGYAAGTGKGSEGRTDIILYCTINPSKPFNTVTSQ